jgi:hypothetical protein
MKKFSISFAAIAFAVLCFAFTNKKFAEGPACNDSLYWFKVKAVLNITCGQVDEQSDFEPIVDVDGDGLLTNVDYIPVQASSHPYGCQDVNSTACALGYRQTGSSSTNQIESFIEGGVVKFRPILAKIPEYRCCIKRPIVP